MARDWVVLGVTLGLLVGCKAPGVYSSAALVSGAGLAWSAARRRSGAARLSWPAALAVVSGVALLTGGIWLVRNTWLFGRPVDVYTDRFYLSVMQDVRTVYGGDWLQAWRRAGIMIGRLLGPHFLAWGAAIVWLVAESAAVLLRRRPDPVATARLWFVCLMTLVACVHVAGLVGAPWTSLESTDGGSLRYLLPFWVLYAFLAFVGLFSRLFPWHRVAALRTIAWLLLAAGATWQAAARHGAGGLNPGTDFLASLVATAALIAAAAALPSDRGPSQPRSRALLLARSAVVVLAAAGAATWLGNRHAALLAAAEREESDRLQAWLTTRQPSARAHQQVFLDVRADEVSRGRACPRRRFFVASRFDLPLDLQPARFTSQVFDSRGFEAVLPLMRQSPGEGVCDYAIVSRDELTREAIRLFSSRLRPIESTGPFLTYEIVRPSAGSGNGVE